MSSFFKMLAQTGSRKRAADLFASKYQSQFGQSLTEDQYKCYKGCLLSIHSGSNNGPIEDCVRFLYRDLKDIITSTMTVEQKQFFISSLKEECYEGNTQKYGYWWAEKILNEFAQMI